MYLLKTFNNRKIQHHNMVYTCGRPFNVLKVSIMCLSVTHTLAFLAAIQSLYCTRKITYKVPFMVVFFIYTNIKFVIWLFSSLIWLFYVYHDIHPHSGNVLSIWWGKHSGCFLLKCDNLAYFQPYGRHSLFIMIQNMP